MKNEPLRAISDFIQLLSNAIASSFLYSVDHPQVTPLIPRVVLALHEAMGRESEQVLVFVNDLILYQGKPLAATPQAQRVAKTFLAQEIGFIKCLPGVTAGDVRHLLLVLVGLENKVNFRKNSLTLRIGDIDVPVDGEVDGKFREIASFEDLTPEELERTVALYEAVESQEDLNLKDLAAMIGGFIAAFRREANPLFALVPLRQLDEYTFTHSINVSILNLAQGMSLGIEGQLLHDIGIAGMLHDAGKIFVDKEITTKPGKLTDEQWLAMKQHPSRGAQYLLNQPDIPRVAVITAFEHHMRYDLQGYPSVPKSWQLNMCSQMTMISDTFDALRTRRIYKDPWDFTKTSGHMLTLAGAQLNPELTLNFLQVLARLGEH